MKTASVYFPRGIAVGKPLATNGCKSVEARIMSGDQLTETSAETARELLNRK